MRLIPVTLPPGRARLKPRSQRIAGGGHDDGDRCGSQLGCKGRERSRRHDYIDVEPDQFRREFMQPFEPILRIPALEDDVLAFDPAQLPKGVRDN
jgi:hypothetical protein